MKYKVGDAIYDSIDDVLSENVDEEYHWDDEYFEEWVNDDYGSVCIYGNTYYAYDILEQMNPSELSDLRESFCRDQNESDIEDARYELMHSEVGDEVYFQNVRIEVIEDEDCEEDSYEEPVCHEASIESVRLFIEDQKLLEKQAEIENKKAEDDMMTLFQVIK